MIRRARGLRPARWAEPAVLLAGTGVLAMAVTASPYHAVDLARMTGDLERGQWTLKGMVLDLMRAQRPRGGDGPPA